MTALQFSVMDWLGRGDSESSNEATLASLRIVVRDEDGCMQVVTEVDDTASRTVRQHANLSAYPLAQWLVANWWRLRWEPSRSRGTPAWHAAHTLASLGEGYVWPPLSLSSDGEGVQLSQCGERFCDVAAIRYLNSIEASVPTRDFELAVDQFVNQVIDRLACCGHRHGDLAAARDELAAERADPAMALVCSLQARAGIDPGEAPPGWQEAITGLGVLTGPGAVMELAAALPELPGGLDAASQGLEALRQSRHQVDLSWLRPDRGADQRELPWERGARLAREVRAQIGHPHGPISIHTLGDCFGLTLPLTVPARWTIGGGYRRDVTGRQTTVAVPGARPESQRFFLARIAASALLSSPEDSYLAVTDAGTAMQKAGRSFAQEFLCPWRDLDHFTDDHGIEEDAIAEAAGYFQVSEWLVLTTLVNKGKLPRNRLPHASR